MAEAAAAARLSVAFAPYVPAFGVAVRALMAVRVIGTVVLHYVTDCDETFNYIEPLHYLLHGFGMQTWEYAPQFALRSYAYLLPHEMVARLLGLLALSKMTQLTYFKVALALFCVAGEVYLYHVLAKRLRGSQVPQLTLCILLGATGMFVAAPAFLPSSFAMVMVSFAFGAYLDRRDWLAVLCIAIASIVGWPFAAFVGLPLALEMCSRRGLGTFAGYALSAGLLVLIPTFAIDSQYYGKPVLAAFNIVRYNVLAAGAGHGPELYGVEPWYFYLLNATLNFNVAFVAALLAPLACYLPHFALVVNTADERRRVRVLVWTTIAWLAVMSAQPHKEERFLSPIYTLVAVAGAVTVSVVLVTVDHCLGAIAVRAGAPHHVHHVRTRIATGLGVLFVLVFFQLSFSRTYNLSSSYAAPDHIYRALAESELGLRASHSASYPVPGVVNVCVGKEWHRFGSSFALPSERFRVRWLRSGFGGLLPRPFTAINGTSAPAPDFNDRNQERTDRYFDDVSRCHYLVELELNLGGPSDASQAHYVGRDGWDVVYAEPFLDAAATPVLTRVLYLPHYSAKLNRYGMYALLKNEALLGKTRPPAGSPAEGKSVRSEL